MRPRLRAIAKKPVLILVLVIGVTVGVLCLPRNVEGVYSAGKLIQCACDGSDYLRFHNGMVAHYSTNHEPANLIGRYEVRSDGSVAIFMTPLRNSEPEKIVATLGRPRIGFAVASTPGEDESCMLVRLPATGKIKDLFAGQDVTKVNMPDETSLVTTFYDAELAEVRREAKLLNNRAAEQDAGDQAPAAVE